MKKNQLSLALFSIALLALSACGKKCDWPNSWDEKCGTPPSSVTQTDKKTDSGNQPAPNSTVPVKIEVHQPPARPQEISVTGKFNKTPGLISSSSYLIFSADVNHGSFSPSMKSYDFTYTQLDLDSAKSMELVSPSPNGCEIPQMFGMVREGASNAFSLFVKSSASCASLLTAMKTSGFTLKFKDVQYYGQTETVPLVTYKVSF